jgi:hypothetical protein
MGRIYQFTNGRAGMIMVLQNAGFHHVKRSIKHFAVDFTIGKTFSCIRLLPTTRTHRHLTCFVVAMSALYILQVIGLIEIKYMNSITVISKAFSSN